jgi:hypothetical protein
MRSIKTFFHFCALFLLAGCAASNAHYYQQAVQSWQGSSAQSLVKAWGRPDNRLATPAGNTVLVYQNQGYSAYNSTTSPAVGVNVSPTGRPVIVTSTAASNGAARGASLSCVTLFEVNNKGLITHVTTQGNGCYSNQSFAEKVAKPGTQLTTG